MKLWRDARALRWALLPWLGLLYLWGLVFLNVSPRGAQPGLSVLFTLLMGLHAGLYVSRRRLIDPPVPRPFVLYAGAQSVLVLLISWIAVPNLLMLVALPLALMAEAITTLPPQRRAEAVAVYGVLCGLVVILENGGNVARGAAIYLLIVLPVLVCLLGYVVLYQRQVDTRERAQVLLRELEVAHGELAAYADRVEDLTLLTERQRMARELHDTLAQGLAGVILQLEAARLRLASGETQRAGEIIDQAQNRARTALAAARHAIDDLRAGPTGPVDAYATVEEEIRRFSAATGMAVEADIAALATLPADSAEQAARAIVEGLTNALRHAQARHVWIRVVSYESRVEIMVRDDGVGFDVAAAARQTGHYGLLGLRERARLTGGDVQVISGPGQGTTVRLCMPRPLDQAVPLDQSVPLGGRA